MALSTNPTRTRVEANFVDILLKAANADLSPRDLPALANLMKLCMKGDLDGLARFETHPNPRISGEARFIMREHKFAVARRAAMHEQRTLTQATLQPH
jgi:hypothetical protein